MVRCGFKNGNKKARVKKRLDYLFKIRYSFKFNSGHDWEHLHDCLMNTKIFTLIVHKIFISSPKNTRNVATILV